MKSNLFEGTTCFPGTPNTSLDGSLAFPRTHGHSRGTAIPYLRVLPPPKGSPPDESWVVIEMRRRTRFELRHDVLFLILFLSGAAAIICAFLATYP